MTELYPVARIDPEALRELEKHTGASATVWSAKARHRFALDAAPLVTLSQAQSAIAERDARIAELDEEIGRLEDENSDLRCEPWPEWARAVLKVIRKHSGYDGYDDATEGVDMPLELSEHLSVMEAEAGRWKARAEAAEALLKEAGKVLDKLEAVALKQPIAGGPDNVHLHNDWRGWWNKLFRPAMQEARSLASKIGGGE